MAFGVKGKIVTENSCSFTLKNFVSYLTLTLCLLDNFHDILSSADFFQNQLFRKILSGIPSEYQQFGSRSGSMLCQA